MTPPPLTTSRHLTRSTLSPQASATSRPASGGAPPVPQQPSPHGKRRVTRDLDPRLDSGSQGVFPVPPPTVGGTGNTPHAVRSRGTFPAFPERQSPSSCRLCGGTTWADRTVVG